MKNELNLGVSIEDVDKLIVSYYEPKSNEDLTDLQEKNKTPPEAEDCKSHPAKTLTVKEMKETFNHHERLLSMMEEIDPNADGSSEVHRTAEWDTGCYNSSKAGVPTSSWPVLQESWYNAVSKYSSQY